MVEAGEIIGRVDEQSRIEGLFADAQRDRSRVLVLEGEPGMGKSTLIDYAISRAEGKFLVLRDTGRESERSLSYGSLSRLLRPVADRISSMGDPRSATVLTSLLSLGPAGEVIHDRFAPGLATLSLLASLSDQTPVAVVVDDLQWVDQATLDTLVFVAHRLEAEGVVMLLTRRSGRVGGDLASLPHLHLGGLDDESAGLLLRRRMATLVEDRVHFLVQATGGNPLALEELPVLVEAEKLAGTVPLSEPLPLPSRLEEVFALRVATLSRFTEEALAVAAILDRSDLRLLDVALGHAGREIDDLAAAEDAGLITLAPEGMRFRHPLVRSAVVQRASPSWRRKAHQAAAVALGEQPDQESQASRTWHLADGCIGLDDEIADLLESLAQEASRLAGFASASHAFERSSQLSRNPIRRSHRLLAAAEAAYQAGDGDRASQLLAAVDASIAPDDAVIERVRLHGRLDMGLGAPARAYDRLTEAAEARAEEDPVGAAQLLLDAVLASAFAGWVDRTYNAALRARSLAAGDLGPTGLISRLSVGAGHVFQGEISEGLAILTDDVDDLVLRLPNRVPSTLPWVSGLAYCRLLTEHYDAADRLCEAIIATATGDGAVAALPFVIVTRALGQWRVGQWDAAAALSDQGAALARQTARVTDLAFALNVTALVRAGQGDEADCLAAVKESLEQAKAASVHTVELNVYMALGLLHLGLGNPHQAQGPLETAEELSGQLGRLNISNWHWAAELAETYVRLGQPARASRQIELLIANAERNPTPASLLFAARSQALVAGRDDYRERYEEALRYAAACGRPFEVARTRLCYGEQLRRHKQKAAARTQLQAAFEQFDLLGAQGYATRARLELEATGQSAAPTTGAATSRLTPQEMQVALAAASGATNAEIAARVFLSTKTVEYHLTHVYRKLDVANREDLAGVLQERGAG